MAEQFQLVPLGSQSPAVFPFWRLPVDIKLQLGVDYSLTFNEYCFYMWVEIRCVSYFASYYYVVFYCCPQATASFSPIVSYHLILMPGFCRGSVLENLLADSGNVVWSLNRKDPLEEENGNPLQYYCLGNPMDRGAWQATILGVA